MMKKKYFNLSKLYNYASNIKNKFIYMLQFNIYHNIGNYEKDDYNDHNKDIDGFDDCYKK